MQRLHAHVVGGDCVHSRAGVEQPRDRAGASEVRGEVERGEAVGGERADGISIGGQGALESFDVAERREIEHVQRRASAHELARAGAVAPVQRGPYRADLRLFAGHDPEVYRNRVFWVESASRLREAGNNTRARGVGGDNGG